MGAGEPSLKQGISIYVYSANDSMNKTAFYNSDGDFLIVPHKGTLNITTLNGKLTVKPREICVIPRGIKFSVDIN
jgi:homogentisate 1,2-dioxygenase